MVAMKRTTAAVVAPKKSPGSRPKTEAEVEHEDVEEQQEEVEASIGEEPEEPEEQMSEEQRFQEAEEAERARRVKELKAMPVGDLKELVAGKGLDAGIKADMVEAIVAFEAKGRADAREHEAKRREVVVGKLKEFEGQSVSELSKQCAAIGIKGNMSKQQRVEHLLKHWQQADGVDKALAQMAKDERKRALESMNANALQELCAKADVDPFVAEVMVDRISKREHEMGHYSRPVPVKSAEATPEAEANTDMVTALLESEKNRKREKEISSQQEEAASSKRKEFRAMTVDELRSALSSKGVEPMGKKEEMVEALFSISVQEDAVVARKSELKNLSVQELKDLLTGKGLETGTKNEMVETLFSYEANLREELKAWQAKAAEVLAQKKDEFEAKSNAELKDLCSSKGLKLGTGKEDRVERLLEEVQRSSEFDATVAQVARKARKDVLSGMAKQELVQLCAKLSIDPLVKEILVERLLAHEAECGPVVDEATEPAAKKARTLKK
eukprot:TRINITY_DN482_c0_g2_i1.p1 TRINITY_DN482_c0_g2~~TRINITY_DN482_c0_g2_i1.p1  ORF type:complete len:525 (-),score=174.37 TRINITY_DN482_c0_g2_i1:227-1726(-)